MSNRRIIRLLLLGIVLLTGVHILLFFKGAGIVLVPRRTLMAEAALSATQVTIDRKGDPSVRLARVDDWRIEQPYAAPADTLPIDRLLDALALAPIADVYSERELLKLGHTRASYGLEDPSVTVSLTYDGKTEKVGFGILSSSGDSVFATREGDTAVYLVSTNVLAAVDLPAEGFRQRELFPKGTSAIDAFEIRRPGEAPVSYSLRDGIWQRLPDRKPASSARIRSMLEALGRARVAAFVWPVGSAGEQKEATENFLMGYGLNLDAAATVTLRASGMPDQRVSFGGIEKDGRVYAFLPAAKALVTVDGTLRDLVDKTDYSDTRLFPFETENVSFISLAEGDVTYRLAKDARDGRWLLETPIVAPADPETVGSLVGRLLSLTSDDRAEKGLSVSAQTNVAPVVVTASSLTGGLDLADLRSREIIRIAPTDVKSVSVTAEDRKLGSVSYDRDLRTWTVKSSEREGAAPDESVSRRLAVLNPLRAEKVLKLKVTADDLHRFGLEKPRHTIAVDFFSEGTLRRNILIGGEATGGGRYATIGADDAVFILSDETVSRLTAPLVTE